MTESHRKEWEKFEGEWARKSKEEGDIWDSRAQSCTSLLLNLNKKKE